MRDYRFVTKVRNNRILERIEATGMSVYEFCEANHLTSSSVYGLLAMKKAAKRPNSNKGEWNKSVVDLATALRCEPEDLFTSRQAAAQFESLVIENKVDEREMLLLDAPEVLAIEAPDEELHFAQRQAVGDLLKVLTPREERVIRLRFGIGGGGELTLEDTAEQFNVQRERIRQIEAKAMRKMKSRVIRNRGLPQEARR